MSGVSNESLHDKFDQAVEHVEQLKLTRIFGEDMSRAFLLTSSLRRRACYLRQLSVQEVLDPGDFPAGTPGDLILDALVDVPSLERLELDGLTFSCPVVLERFLAKTPKLRILHMAKIKSISGKAADVAKGFRRGIQLNQTLTEVSLHGRGTEKCIYKEIVLALTKHKQLEQLQLYSSGFGGTVERFLIANTTSIKTLHMNCLMEDPSGCHAADIFLGLAQNVSIENFHICGMRKPPSESSSKLADAVEELFTNNKHLRVLDLDGFRFGGTTSQALIEGLDRTATLQEVRLFSTKLEGVSNKPFPIWKLQAASFCYVGLQDTHFRSLSQGLLHDRYGFRLQKLDLEGNAMTVASLTELSQGLTGGGGKCLLKELNMNGCGLDEDAAPLLAGIIRETELERLQLSGNKVSVEGFRVVIETVRTSAPSMRVLHLDDVVGETDHDGCLDAVSSELRALLFESGLTELDIGNPKRAVGTGFTTAIAEGLRENGSLESLTLPKTEPSGLELIGKALTRNTTLTKLSFSRFRGEDDPENDEDEVKGQFRSAVAFLNLLAELEALQKLDDCPFDLPRLDDISRMQLENALVSSMKSNKSLQDVSGGEIFLNDTAQFYFRLNRFGRRYLGQNGQRDSSLPLGVWPHVLAKMRHVENASERYYFLRHNVALLTRAAETGSQSQERESGVRAS